MTDTSIYSAELKPSKKPRLTRAALILEWSERLVIVALYGWLVYKIVVPLVGGHGNMGNLLLLFSEGTVLIFVLFRRSTNIISTRPIDWFLAFSATVTPLFVYPTASGSIVPPVFGTMVLMFGLLVQVYAKLILGRSFGGVPANRGLKLYGPYRFVRHPIYAGYLLTDIGFLLMNPTWWNLAVYVIFYCLQVPRLLAEERLLSQDENYSKYMKEVRFRLIPGVF
jgi:protein-S-isoprenylcysteine O-methyltransferase Ste14